MKSYIFLAIISLWLMSCTKEVPQEFRANNNQKSSGEKEMPDDSIHRKFKTDPHQMQKQETESGENDDKNDEWTDEKANKISLEADEMDAKYRKSKSDADKKVCIRKQMEAANYLMFEADLPPREKYKPALQRYRRVLELEPGNEEAIANKEQIEEIYRSLGKPIPN